MRKYGTRLSYFEEKVGRHEWVEVRLPGIRGQGAAGARLLTQVQMQAKKPPEGLRDHYGGVAEVGEIDHEQRE